VENIIKRIRFIRTIMTHCGGRGDVHLHRLPVIPRNVPTPNDLMVPTDPATDAFLQWVFDVFLEPRAHTRDLAIVELPFEQRNYASRHRPRRHPPDRPRGHSRCLRESTAGRVSRGGKGDGPSMKERLPPSTTAGEGFRLPLIHGPRSRDSTIPCKDDMNSKRLLSIATRLHQRFQVRRGGGS
jgi:hypothetical protein